MLSLYSVIMKMPITEHLNLLSEKLNHKNNFYISKCGVENNIIGEKPRDFLEVIY